MRHDMLLWSIQLMISMTCVLHFQLILSPRKREYFPLCCGKERPKVLPPGGGGTSLWVRRGCAPVLGSFWPENSGIGVSFYWNISVIGLYFHSEFSGIGGYSKFCNGC